MFVAVKAIRAALSACLLAGVTAQAALVLTQVPAGMRKATQSITVAWTGGEDRVYLRASTTPGGGASIAHYDSLHLPSQTPDGVFSFTINPDIPALYRNTDLRLGVNYCILTDGTQISPEFIIIVESSVAPTLTSPTNAASIKDLTPVFSWSGSAPYYTVLVSDEPFKISDSGTVTGVSAIWQVITPYTSAHYGDPDPSGGNTVPAPPLISGKTYNWLVLNNYANNAGSTSKVAPVPASFTYAPAPPLAAAGLIEPADADTVHGSDQIKFRWGLVDSAVSYKLELLEENTVDGSQADVALWKASSTGGQIVLDNASSLLRRYRYKWRVYAVGGNGSASISAKRSFFYDIPVGDLSVFLRNTQDQAVAYVAVKVNRLGGVSSGVFQSGSTDADGVLSLKNAPFGKYEVSIDNADGYLSRKDTIDLQSTSGASKITVLTPVLGKVLGKVTNGSGAPILNAKVSFSGSDGSSGSALTNSQGDYSLGLRFGNYQVSAKADGYVASGVAAASLSASAPAKAADFQLKADQFTISGTVKNSFAQVGIFGATVYLTQNGETRTASTDGKGAFSFPVASGTALLRASSPGFASPEPQTVSIDADKAVVISLDPNASILSGRTSDASGTALPKASLTAVPRAGPARGVVSDNLGFFELSLPAGDWTVNASAQGYTARAPQKYLLDVSKTVQGVNFTLDPNRSLITGRATENGAGLAGVKVSASSGASILTDNAGFYRLPVNAGSQTIGAAKDGYLIFKTYSVPVNVGDTVTEVNFPATANAGVVRGKVTADGAGVASAKVTATNSASKETFSQTSDVDGSFALSLPPGDYSVAAAKEGFALIAPLPVTLVAGSALNDARVKLANDQGRISGTVASGATPLSGCEVAYVGAANAAQAGKTITDPDGRYSFSLQSGSAYQLTATCAGYQKANATSAVLALNAVLAVDLSPLKAAATYKGTAVDAKGAALAGVKATAERNGEAVSVATDFSGNFEFSLGSGTYTLTLAKLGYRSRSRQLQLSLGVNAAAAPDTLALSAGRLAVHAVSGGASVPGAFVGLTGLSAAGGAASFVLDADGRYTAENLPAGTYLLTASAENYTDGKVPSVTVAENALSNVEVTLAANRGSLSGTAKIGSTGAANVKIAATGPGFSRGAVTGADGSYLIDKLPAGVYAVTAALSGFSPDKAWSGQALSNPGSLTGLDFSLAKNDGALSGSVTGASTASGIQVSLLGKKGNRASASCDAAGRYVIPSIPADVYTLTVSAPGYKLAGATQNPEITVTAATTYNPALLPAVFQLSGKVLNQAGQGLAGLPVELRAAGSILKATSGADGSFSVSDVPSGDDYLLSVKPPTSDNDPRDTAFSEPLDAPAKATVNLNTISRRAEISGAVTLDGKAAEGALLRLSGFHNDLTGLSQPGGGFRIQRVAGSDSTLILSVSLPGSRRLDTAVVVKPAEAKSGISVALKTLKLALNGTLKDSEGKAVVGGKVVLASARGFDTVVTEAGGAFAFANLSANQSVTLATQLDRAKYDNAEQAVSLKEKDSTLALVAVVHAASVTVTVHDLNNAAVDGAEVLMNGRSLGVTSGGVLRALNLARGDYRFLAGKASYKGSPESAVSLSGDTAAAVTLIVTKLTGGLYGVLSDTGLGAPAARKLAGAEIALASSSDTLRDTVNSLGQFFIDGMVPGRKYGVMTSLPGYRTPDDSVTGSAQVQNRDIAVTPFPGTVTGRVAGGKAGVRVRLFHVAAERFLEGRTTLGGYYAFTGLQNRSDYAVQAFDGSAASPWHAFSAGAAIVERADLDAALRGGVTGSITSGGKALSGALVTGRDEATGASAWDVSDASGHYALAGLPGGRETLTAERLGYRNAAQRQAAVGSDGATSGIDLDLAAGQSGITGTVTDGATGLAAQVLLTRGSDTVKAQSAEGGQFLFAGLAAGDYLLSAARPGYASPSPAAVTFDGASLPLRDVTLPLKNNRVAGVVRDAVTNTPAAGATVSSGAAQAVSDSLGRFELTLPGTAASPLRLDVSKSGYLTREKIPVYLGAGASAAQDLGLTADYRFDAELDVLVKEGKDTLAGLSVTLQPFHPDDSAASAVTAKQATSFKNLRRPAPYLVKVKRDGFKDISRFIELSGNTPVTLILSYPTSQLRLLVTADGRKGRGVDLSLDGKAMTQHPDTAGLYESSAKLAPGRYEVSLKDLDPAVIPMASHFVDLGEDSVRTDTLPLAFRVVPIEDSIIATDFDVKVARTDTLHPAPAVVCSLYYRAQGDPVWAGLKLDSSAGGFLGKLPAQDRAGAYEYFYVVHSPQGVRSGTVTPGGTSRGTSAALYTSGQTPGLFKLRDPFLLYSISLLPQRLETDTSLYSLSAKDIYQVRMQGENGRDLNGYFDRKFAQKDTGFTATWTFDDGAAALAGLTITPRDSTPRLADFRGGKTASDSVFRATCAVRMGAVRLKKSFLIKIQDLSPVSIGIKYVKENRNLESDGAALKLANNNIAGYQFAAFAVTAEGRTFNISPRWSLGSDSAAGKLTQQGTFLPDSAVARGAILVISDSLSSGDSVAAFSFHTNLTTYTQVTPADSGTAHVANGEGMLLDFPLAGLAKSFTITLQKPVVSGLQRSSPQEEAVGDIIDVELSESQPFKADSGAMMTLPVKPGIARQRKVYLGHWNTSALAWERLDSAVNAEQVSGKVRSFSKYAVIMGSLPLGAYDIVAVPNPFSALDPYGLQLGYKVSSDVSSQVGVKVEVYNMMGDKVYESLETQIGKGDAVTPGAHKADPQGGSRRTALGPYVWDGRDSKGVLCRNGRYLLKLTVKDGAGKKEYLKKVVMLK